MGIYDLRIVDNDTTVDSESIRANLLAIILAEITKES